MKRVVLTAVAAVLLLATGCANSEPGVEEGRHPATLQPIAGTDLNKVTLTDLAARQLGLQTVPVAAVPAPAKVTAAQTSIPLTALVYGPDGDPWTYAQIATLTYQREPVVIDHITTDTVLLRSGPAVGTPVVSVGGQELLGAEYGVGEE